MKLKDLKIGVQLKICFGIILLLIVLLGFISWMQSRSLSQMTTELYEHPLTVRTAISDLKTDILIMQRGMKELATVENEQDFATILKEIDVCRADANKQFEILNDRYLGPKTNIDSLFKTFVEWNTIRGETLLLFRSGKVKEAIRRTTSTGVGGSHVGLLMDRLKVVDDFSKRKATTFFQNSILVRQSLTIQLFVFLAVILLVSILLIQLLMRNIRRPLLELNAVTKHFQAGKIDERCTYTSKNELGQLSESFNNLADTIQDELKLNSKVSKLSGVMLGEDEAHRFCHELLLSLIENTHSQMAAIYLLNDEKTYFEHFECIGMFSSGCKPFSATKFEGEFGTALSTKKIQHITNIPEDTRFTFSTVVGEFIPREILTIPIVTGNETVAVISLCNIKSYSKSSLNLISHIISTLSARMGGILAHRKIVAFLQKLEYQNIELESQKNELSAQSSELTEQNIELEMQKRQLDEANKMKSSFLSNMSHELRTPLNSVIALSGVLNRRLAGKVPEEEYGYLDVIERNGKHLLLLINDILDLSRIEAGREEVEIESFNPTEIIREVLEMIEPQAKQKNIGLNMVVSNKSINITSDLDKFHHILQNLIGNAVKFTEEGGVEIALKVNGDKIHISVQDTGIGIDEVQIPHIFDEFTQADGSNSRKYGGTGLGLAIAKKYAEMLGGSIEVESTKGKGTRFILILPVTFPANLMAVNLLGERSQTKTIKTGEFLGEVHTEDKTILLVEDSEAIVIQMKDMLTTQGYQVLVARDGKEAMEQLSHGIPDGVILDLMMPDVDGFEVLKNIRENGLTDKLPVIILTAKYVTKEELSFLKHNSIYQLIQKGDINKDQLLRAVAGMLHISIVEEKSNPIQSAPVSVSGIPVILVVEDNPDNMITIKALLDGSYQVLEADNGNKGIELALQHHPHLILMDIALPDINGIETLKEIRKDSKLMHIPVIAVSASAMKGDREDFIAQGFDDYVSKPIDDKNLSQVINKWIKI